MRWRKCQTQYPSDGESRIIRKFLWWPKCIGNEYRWLEFVRIRQHYVASFFTGDLLCGAYWVDDEFLS